MRCYGFVSMGGEERGWFGPAVCHAPWRRSKTVFGMAGYSEEGGAEEGTQTLKVDDEEKTRGETEAQQEI